MRSFASGLITPVIGSSRSGLIVASCQEETHIYEVDQGANARCVAKAESLPAKPLAVLPAHEPYQFSLFLSDGTLHHYAT
jgi:hypothetical protein